MFNADIWLSGLLRKLPQAFVQPSPALLICAKGVWGLGKPKMVKFGRASRARPHGRRVLGRSPFGPRKQVSREAREVCLCAVSGAVEAVWDARWQVFGHVGSRSWALGRRSRSAAS